MTFLLLAAPALATGEVDVEITILPIVEFTVNHGTLIIYTYDRSSVFDVPQDLGNVEYDLYVNQGWQIEGIILDDSENDQTADDWDAVTWILSINDVIINETEHGMIDSGDSAVARTGNVWKVLLTIPRSEGSSTSDCTIELTASGV